MNESTLVPREKLSDLDWLARNVHVWPTSTPHIVPPGDSVFEFGITFFKNHAFMFRREYTHSKVVYKKQWLARRAELQNKPSWDDFGKSAKFMAQDSDGAWRAFESEPTAQSLIWNAKRGWRGYAYEYTPDDRGEVLGDWRDTLEKRPEQKAFEPLTSIEDNQEKDMKQDNGWFERGELPPVGVKCETLAEPELQWVSAEVVAHRDGFAIVWITSEKCGAQSDAPKHFRPIRTERDVLLSIITEELNHYDTDGKLANAILAAGFKRDGSEK